MGYKPKLFSVLTERVIPFLLADETLGKRQLQMYNRLRNVVRIALYSSQKVVVTDRSTYAVVWCSNQSEIGVGKMVFLQLSTNLKPFRYMLALFGKYKSARPHNCKSFFIGRMVWFVEKNFFANIFNTKEMVMVINGNIHKPLCFL